jgi:hypothetical protein
MTQFRLTFVWASAFLSYVVAPASAQLRDPRDVPRAEALTCDAGAVNPDSYALSEREQAHIVNEDRSSWWDGFNVGNAKAALSASVRWESDRSRISKGFGSPL